VFIFHQDSPDKYSPVQEIATKTGAKTMGYDPKTRRVVVPTSENGAMQVMVSPQPHNRLSTVGPTPLRPSLTADTTSGTWELAI